MDAGFHPHDDSVYFNRSIKTRGNEVELKSAVNVLWTAPQAHLLSHLPIDRVVAC